MLANRGAGDTVNIHYNDRSLLSYISCCVLFCLSNEERVPMFRVPKRPDEFFDIKMDLDRRINRNKEVRTRLVILPQNQLHNHLFTPFFNQHKCSSRHQTT